MKQRIQNALYQAVLNGRFYRYTVDAKTGQMTAYMDKVIKPAGCVVHESRSSYRDARAFRRSHGASELESWTFVARVQFAGHVLCESFEDDVTATGIKIPPIAGMEGQRTLLARLRDSSYDHGPEQDPSAGTLVEFTFEIDTTLLRK